ncbi:MAG: hypothetical protein GF330_14830 [Candidatus Eisenbacteria bacterium]|nr:hypothetical protein [Candidatus Eisenbacteria bacterium]
MARDLAELLERYLGAWLGRPGRALSRSAVAGALQEAGVPEALAERARALLAWTDEVRFAATGGEQAPQRREEMRELLAQLESALRRGPLGRGR